MKNCFIMLSRLKIHIILFLGVVRSTSILSSIPLVGDLHETNNVLHVCFSHCSVTSPRLHNGQYNNGGCFTDCALLYNRTSCIYLLILSSKHICSLNSMAGEKECPRLFRRISFSNITPFYFNPQMPGPYSHYY